MTERVVTLMTIGAILMIVLFLLEVMGDEFWYRVFTWWDML